MRDEDRYNENLTEEKVIAINREEEARSRGRMFMLAAIAALVSLFLMLAMTSCYAGEENEAAEDTETMTGQTNSDTGNGPDNPAMQQEQQDAEAASQEGATNGNVGEGNWDDHQSESVQGGVSPSEQQAEDEQVESTETPGNESDIEPAASESTNSISTTGGTSTTSNSTSTGTNSTTSSAGNN